MNERDILNLNNRITEVEDVVKELVISSIQENAKTTEDFKNKVNEAVSSVDSIVADVKSIESNIDTKLQNTQESLLSRISNLQSEIARVKTIKGDKGDKGDSYTLTEKDRQDIANKIEVPVVEKVIEKTEVIKEVQSEINLEEEIKKLPDDSINMSMVKGLRKILTEISQSKVGQFVQSSSMPLRIFSSGNIVRENTYTINFTGATVTPTHNGVDVAINGGGSSYTFQNGVTETGGVVELGGSGALTSLNINGSSGNGHVHLKHQSVAPNSQTSASTIFADVNGRAGWVNDGLGLETLAYKSEVDSKATPADIATAVSGLEEVANKNANGGYAGLETTSNNSKRLFSNSLSGMPEYQVDGWHIRNTNPTSVDDETTGIVAQDKWINTNGSIWICTDPSTGSASWIKIADTNYLSPSSIGTTVQAFDSNTTLLGNTTTGTGSIVRNTSPTLVTPTLGVASATSINRVAFTQPATGSTLTILNGKTLTVNNTITLAGTDSRVYTLPTTNATIARTDAAQTFTGVQTFNNAINGANGADIASAATTNIGAATGNYVNITGTTTITSLGTSNAGVSRTVQFAGILTLTHNATSLILPTGANITTAAGDVAMFQSLGAGNWRCTGYMRANGQPLAGGGSTDISCRVTRSSDYNGFIGNSVAVAIPWNAETFDTNTMHDNVTNPSRITFNTAGKYQINVVLIPSQNLANGAYAWIRLNGSTNISGTLNKGINIGSSAQVFHLSFSELYSFAAGDYIEIMAVGNTGTLDISQNSYVTAIRMA